jgi:tripartite-type tricarboxylate transporter receptor subunit TctC
MRSTVKFSRRHCLRLAVAAFAMLTFPWSAGAQSWPTKPVRLIVPFAPGGTTDTFARLIAQKLGEHFGQQFYVENLPGASGNTGTAQAARSSPDGHTILVAFSSFVVNPTLFDKLPYDPYKDFAPVTLAVVTTHVLTVNPSLQAQTVKDLIGLIKSNPGKYSYASPGAGTQAHLLAEKFRLSLGLDLPAVPFTGAGPAIASVVAGHTPIGLSSPVVAGPHIKEGTLRALAITSKTRSQILPDVPTMAEAGHPDIEGDSWVGILVPAGTPKEIITALHRETGKIITLPDMKERLAALGFERVASTPEEFAQRIRVEIETWGKVIQAVNIKTR